MKLRDLIDSTRQVRTRQYETRRVGSVDFNYIHTTKMLYITALAFPLDPDSRKVPYKINLVFKNITSSEVQDKVHTIPYSKDGMGIQLYLPKLSVNTEVMIRCQCPDYYFMWQYWNKGVKSLIGPHKPYVRKTTHYPPRNPTQKPGLCKHQLMLVKLLMEEGIITRHVKNYQYITRPAKRVL